MALNKKTKELIVKSEIERIFRRRVEVSKAAIRKADQLLKNSARGNKTRKKGQYWCSYCGGKFEATPSVCPHCGARLHLFVDTKCKLVYKKEHYLKEFASYGDWQVIKTYVLDSEHRSGSEVKTDLFLAYSWWFNPKIHKTYLYSRYIISPPGWQRIPFSRNSTFRFLSERAAFGYWYGGWDATLVSPKKVLRYYRDRGIMSGVYGDYEDEKIWHALTVHDTALETLAKLGYEDAVSLFIDNKRYRDIIIKCWRGIIIALRHGCDISAIGWRNYLDYLHELKELKLDWHSPHYLCPANFNEAHAATSRRMTRKMEERMARMAEGRRRAELQRDINARRKKEEAISGFYRRIVKFLPLNIEGLGIIIRPLASVDEFKEEGAAMEHCVYSMAYYARPESLILSARSEDDGKRLETVEVDLHNFTVVQSRAKKNGTSERHDDIVSLVNAAMPKIRLLAAGV